MKKILATILTLAACLSLTACNTATENSDSKISNVSEPESSAPFTYDGMELVRAGELFRITFDDLASLEESSDVAVVGTFIDDSVNAGFSFGGSLNTIEVTKVLFGDVNVGDKLVVGQHYYIDEEDGRLITHSDMTPMVKGDEWLFFLGFEPKLKDTYWYIGDSDGRYPVPNSTQNSVMPLSEYWQFGVYEKQHFKQNIYDEILEKYEF